MDVLRCRAASRKIGGFAEFAKIAKGVVLAGKRYRCDAETDARNPVGFEDLDEAGTVRLKFAI
jgi:hypothetical protein